MSQWQSVLRDVERSIYAEQVFCSYVTQMTFMPQFKDQPALRQVHRENYETSYHRNTAAGNLHRLAQFDEDELLVLMTVECFIETRKHDNTALTALRQVTTSDPTGRKLLERAFYWHDQRKHYLKRAAGKLYTMLGPELWQKGVALAE
ncbi:hypothetical protein GCM10025857_31490 [Alicyclobacillus contaminans]|uniref:hypothetical protein n=1 Tax=Alicyclobacillus contaminans TaxID=392016 RepID=UPI00047D2B6A|nr:hypothetical protein [Alicyclobacillus contaminans]GMA51792.1 hypothetical protein GCM10025857_31490 [Alicyclobacillus contaminans]